MRMVMPLFEFDLKGTTRFVFTNCALAIEPLTDSDIQRIAQFSELDIISMERESWALA